MENDGKKLIGHLGKLGIAMLSDTDRINRASSAANTYIFSGGSSRYVLDPAFGADRRKEIREHIGQSGPCHVLCTHYHNDHSANNGMVAGRNSHIYYHHRIKPKINYFRTNGTGQIRVMAREMDLEGMLKRFRMFPGWLILLVVSAARISPLFADAFLFVVGYLYSRKNIGAIRPGQRRAKYLEAQEKENITLENALTCGWRIDGNLIALEAPGHTDDHLLFYLADRKVLFTGDALNYLNGNDIQFGQIEAVDGTFDLIIDFVRKEKVEVLLSGHYYPVIGTAAILEHAQKIKEKHRQMYAITSETIETMGEPLVFDRLLEALGNHPADLARQTARISFPRSTLVFLDVYLLKVLQSRGYTRGHGGKWTRSAVN